MGMNLGVAGIAVWGLALWAQGAPEDAAENRSPFAVTVHRAVRGKTPAVELRFSVPPGYVLYAEHIGVSSRGQALPRIETPPPVRKPDPFTGEIKAVYDRDFAQVYAWPPGDPPVLKVEFQGCDAQTCFLPEEYAFRMTGEIGTPVSGTEETPVVAAPPEAAGWPELLKHNFRETARRGGYLDAKEFAAFLRGPSNALASPARGGWMTLALVLLGGLALNLTPCVLPMIPVNLAIIGAGARAGSRGRGFLLGGVYGAGMALAYGALGLVVVLTRSVFGALNSSPGFNLAMAALFVVLAAAMAGWIPIDFSRFQRSVGVDRIPRGTVALALAMGVVAALLAGACVAPAVISVLALSGSLFGEGRLWGLALPFLLGAGMGLPWPFAGAGLSFLPKPGRWMTGLKYAFSLLILAFGLYYGHLGISLLSPKDYDPAAEDRRLTAALVQARAEGKPVLIDLWAHWCKNCVAMDRTTFRDPEVKRALSRYIVVKYQAERPGFEPARSALRTFDAPGLPAYRIYEPVPAAP